MWMLFVRVIVVAALSEAGVVVSWSTKWQRQGSLYVSTPAHEVNPHMQAYVLVFIESKLITEWYVQARVKDRHMTKHM